MIDQSDVSGHHNVDRQLFLPYDILHLETGAMNPPLDAALDIHLTSYASWRNRDG